MNIFFLIKVNKYEPYMDNPTIIIHFNNEELSDVLSKIGGYYLLAEDTYRAKTFLNAANSVKNFHEDITSGAQAKKEIKGIGVSVAAVIDEFLTEKQKPEEKREHVSRLKELECKFSQQKDIINYFTSFYAIGPAHAVEFYNKGFRTSDDLLQYADLDQAQKLGIIWHDDISKRIPREEISIIKNLFVEIFKPYGIVWDIAGSYRREEESSGDIDVLIQSRQDLNMEGIIYLLRQSGLLTADLALGSKVYRGILKLPTNTYAGYENTVGHRIDIKMIDPKSYSYALLHFTGCYKFNILCRQKAKTLGLKLNEYGLFSEKDKTKLYVATSEEDIFNYLGIVYIPPNERKPGISCLEHKPKLSLKIKV